MIPAMALEEKPLCVVLIGIPYSGKSTFVSEHAWLRQLPKISFDDEVMTLTGGDYSQWSEVAEQAGINVEAKQIALIEAKRSFLIDKTNVSTLERDKLMLTLKEHGYVTAAIVFEPPTKNELKRRRQKRTDKIIPVEVIAQMRRNFEDGKADIFRQFDSVLFISQNKTITVKK